MRPTCLRALAAELWREAEVPCTGHWHPLEKEKGTGKERRTPGGGGLQAA